MIHFNVNKKILNIYIEISLADFLDGFAKASTERHALWGVSCARCDSDLFVGVSGCLLPSTPAPHTQPTGWHDKCLWDQIFSSQAQDFFYFLMITMYVLKILKASIKLCYEACQSKSIRTCIGAKREDVPETTLSRQGDAPQVTAGTDTKDGYKEEASKVGDARAGVGDRISHETLCSPGGGCPFRGPDKAVSA